MPSPLATFPGYTYYYPLTVPACSTGEVLQASLPNLNVTPGLKPWGYVRDDLKDLRVAYWNGSTWAQIGRDATTSIIKFQAQATHATQTVGTYAIYFGNADESTSPMTFSASYVEDFSGTLPSWLTTGTGGSGTATITGGVMRLYSPADADSAFVRTTASFPRDATYSATVRGKLTTTGKQMNLCTIWHTDVTPAPMSASGTYQGQCVSVRLVESGGTNRVYVLYYGTDNTFRYWTGATWTTTATLLNTGQSYSTNYVTGRIESNGTQWRCIVYLNDGTTALTTTSWVNWSSTKNGGAGFVDYIHAGDPFNNFFNTGASQYFNVDSFSYEITTKSATWTNKLNRNIVETLVLDSEQTTNAAVDYGFGADQATGRQVAIEFTPSTTDVYQKFEVLVRQRDTTAIKAYDLTFEVQTDSGGVPSGTVVGRAVQHSLAVEKSTGSFQWMPVWFPSTMTLTGATPYHLVITVNGAGSATSALDFAAASTGSTMSVRTRTTSTWGAWGASGTLGGCIRVYRGWYAMPDRRVNLETHDGTAVATVNNTPSWEADYPTDSATADSEAIYVTDLEQVNGSWRGVYCAYENRVDADLQIFAGMGVVEGASLTSLTKRDQPSLIAVPATGETMLWTPTLYDWGDGSAAGYYRTLDYLASVGQEKRKLHHFRSTGANWYQSWVDDGKVTYPCPPMVNCFAPKVWDDNGTIKLQFVGELVDGDTKQRCMIGEKATNTTLVNLIPVYVDLTDIAYGGGGTIGNAAPGGTTRTSDGIYHTMLDEQKAITDSAGGYYFQGWCADSANHLVYAPPYLLLPRDAAIVSEYLGATTSGSVGIVGDTNLVYGAISRYGAGANPKVVGQTNRATVSIGLTPAAYPVLAADTPAIFGGLVVR